MQNQSVAVRRRAVIRTAVTALIAAIWIAFIIRARGRGVEWIGPGIALPLVPFVYFATELILGRTVPDLARSWDALAGWQRGVIGTLVAVSMFGIMMIVALLFAAAR